MPLQNKNRIAYLGALTLLFSYAEMFIPRILPFFRIGLGNIVILLALPLNLSSFFLLTIIKSVASCFMAGTLFSPFFLISLFQSIFSGFSMFFLFRVNGKLKGKLFSLYGISLVGSAVSAIIQILLSSLYIGKGTFALLGPMMIFSIFSGLITAFFSQNLCIPKNAPQLNAMNAHAHDSCNANDASSSGLQLFRKIVFLAFILIFMTATFMTKNLCILFGFLILGFILQLSCGRKIKILPHVFMWIFILVANIFVPSGKILFQIQKFAITDGALFLGLEKALKLSVAMTLSQCCFKISFKKDSIFSLTLDYFNFLLDALNRTDGNLFKKLKFALQTEN